MKKLRKYGMCIILCLIFGLSACSQAERYEHENQEAWMACLDQGGIPIRSSWSAQMVDCLFNPDGKVSK